MSTYSVADAKSGLPRLIDRALALLRTEITESQWQRVEPALRGDVREVTDRSGNSAMLRVAVCRARKRLRCLLSRDDIYAALSAQSSFT